MSFKIIVSRANYCCIYLRVIEHGARGSLFILACLKKPRLMWYTCKYIHIYSVRVCVREEHDTMDVSLLMHNVINSLLDGYEVHEVGRTLSFGRQS